MSNKPNRDRIFDQILSVEAWHTKFDNETNLASIHVDVSFLKAKLGHETDSKVRFDACLRRAEVSISIPETDPIKVVQGSVARETPLVGEEKYIRNNTEKADIGGSVKISSADPTLVSASLSADASRFSDSQNNLTFSGETREFKCVQYKKDGLYCWEITPRLADRLLGKIWDPSIEPRLSVKHQSNSSQSIGLGCRVHIKCRREDIIIENISIKDGNMKSISDRFKRNREAAASAYIRNVLSNKNLDNDNFDEFYSDLLIADVIIDEEVT